MIRATLEKIFDIREGELFRALSMQLNIFLIITTLLVLKPTINSLFLSTHGIESLPTAYILVAIFAGIITTLYTRIVHQVPFIYLINGTLISSVIVLLGFGFALKIGFWESGILYAFYIWLAIFAVLTTSQFWLLANRIFNVRELKRLIGFIGAGAIAGGIFGGYLTSFLMHYISSIELPFVAAITIGLCLPLTIWIFHRSKATKAYDQNKKEEKPETSAFRLVLQSKHLSYLAAIVAITGIVARLVDYQFGGIASAQITDPEALTAFFGFWFSTFNVAAFTIQLLLTRFVISRFGVGISLLLLPIGIGLAVLALIAAPELLMAAVFMKMADGSLKQSVNKSAMELLILPINTQTKNQTKTFIDVFVDSLATGLSGFILIFVVKGLSLSTTTISFIILGFIGLWILMVYWVEKEYLSSFRNKILDNVSDGGRAAGRIRRSAVFDDIRAIIQRGNSAKIARALQAIVPAKDRRLQRLVAQLLDHSSPVVRVEAIRYLSNFKRRNIHTKIAKMVNGNQPKEVKMAAIAYQIEHSVMTNKKVVNQHLEDPDERLSGAALLALCKEVQNNTKLKQNYNLEGRIRTRLEQLPKITNPKRQFTQKIYTIQAIGYVRIPSLNKELIHFLNAENPNIVREAIQAAGRTKSELFFKELIRFTRQAKFARIAEKALIKYEGQLIKLMTKTVKKASPEDISIIRRFPLVLKKIGTQTSLQFIFRLLNFEDPVVRRKALKTLDYMYHRYPNLRFRKKKIELQVLEELWRYKRILALVHTQKELLKSDELSIRSARRRVILLSRKMLTNRMDNIFALLGLLYSTTNTLAISKGLKSRKPKVRITALEFLDNILERNLKKSIIPVFEITAIGLNQQKDISRLDIDSPSEYECLQIMLRDTNNLRLKIATLNLINQLADPHNIPLVQECIDYNDPELRLYAKEVLEKMRKGGLQVLRMRS
ncbi:MAG: Npt1/Npt2 family nucleotide transporter [Saprospiraceae bacterium]